MARARKAETTGAAAEQPAPQEKPESNGTNGRVVIRTFSYPVSKDTSVQALVEERTVQFNNGGTFTAHEVCTRKVWVTPTGEQKALYTYRYSELYALMHAIRKAEDFILDLREEGEPRPL